MEKVSRDREEISNGVEMNISTNTDRSLLTSIDQILNNFDSEMGLVLSIDDEQKEIQKSTTVQSTSLDGRSIENNPIVENKTEESWICFLRDKCKMESNPVNRSTGYYKLTCHDGCIVFSHPECFIKLKTEKEWKNKKRMKHSHCITPDCPSLLHQILHLPKDAKGEPEMYLICSKLKPTEIKSLEKKKRTEPIAKRPKQRSTTSSVVEEEEEYNDASIEGAVKMPLRHYKPKPVPPPDMEAVPLQRSDGLEELLKSSIDKKAKTKKRKRQTLLPVFFNIERRNGFNQHYSKSGASYGEEISNDLADYVLDSATKQQSPDYSNIVAEKHEAMKQNVEILIGNSEFYANLKEFSYNLAETKISLSFPEIAAQLLDKIKIEGNELEETVERNNLLLEMIQSGYIRLILEKSGLFLINDERISSIKVESNKKKDGYDSDGECESDQNDLVKSQADARQMTSLNNNSEDISASYLTEQEFDRLGDNVDALPQCCNEHLLNEAKWLSDRTELRKQFDESKRREREMAIKLQQEQNESKQSKKECRVEIVRLCSAHEEAMEREREQFLLISKEKCIFELKMQKIRIRAQNAEIGYLKLKMAIDLVTYKNEKQKAEEGKQNAEHIVKENIVGLKPPDIVVIWINFQREWTDRIEWIQSTINKITTDFDHLINQIESGATELKDCTTVNLPVIPPSPQYPPFHLHNTIGIRSTNSPVDSAESEINPLPLSESLSIADGAVSPTISSRASPTITVKSKTQEMEKFSRLLSVVQKQYADVTAEQIKEVVANLRKDKWNGSLPKKMSELIDEVIACFAQHRNSSRRIQLMLELGQECELCLSVIQQFHGYISCPNSTCQEIYHFTCIEEWMNQHRSCPHCCNYWTLESEFPSIGGAFTKVAK